MALGDYELQVAINSFSNPDGRCADRNCGPQSCCEGRVCPNPCHYYFSVCQRPAGTPISTLRKAKQGNCETFNTNASSAIHSASFFADNVFGTSNPIVLTGAQWVSGPILKYSFPLPIWLEVTGGNDPLC